MIDCHPPDTALADHRVAASAINWGQMLDRYDSRHDNHRDRDDSQERDWGSRGGGERVGERDNDGGAFTRHLDLPRGPEREIVRERKRSYELSGPESDALATIAAFRVVQASDIHQILGQDRGERSAHKSLDHLQASGLLERIPLERRDDDVVAAHGPRSRPPRSESM